MRPGDSTEPIWRVRINSGWNASLDGLDVWVLQEEFDTDDSWMGMRVLDQSGHWRAWITDQGATLGPPTQTLQGDGLRGIALLPPTTRGSSPLSSMMAAAGGPPAALDAKALESMRQAMEKAEKTSGHMLVVSPAVREFIREHDAKIEKEFLYGKSTDEYVKTPMLDAIARGQGSPRSPQFAGSFDGQRHIGSDGRNYTWVAAQKKWLAAATDDGWRS